MKRIGPGIRCILGCVAWWLMFAGFMPVLAQDDAARQRLLELRAEIARHDDLYFKRATPEISDAAYDALKREMRALEQAHPELAVESPGMGDDRSGDLPTHPHVVRMLSLDKAYTEAEWRVFHARVLAQLGLAEADFVIEPKYDGLAVSLTYERGRLVRALTRGNGQEGDDVTDPVRAIAGVPEVLASDGAVPARVELRGEVYVTTGEFLRQNAAREALGEKPFAHPRSLAVGTLKTADPAERAGRSLSLVIHGWGAWEGVPTPVSSEAFRTMLQAWGLPTVTRARVARSADDVWAAVQALAAARADLGFPIDGAVVKLDATAWRERLGESDAAPRWAVACKFSAERAIARLRDVTWQVGRSGLLTPVAEFDPVEVGGATVSRATVHNRAVLTRLGLHRGDLLVIERAGEVVPAIVEVQAEKRPAGATPITVPSRCPACAAAVVESPGEVALRCPNPGCPAQRQRRLEHFVGAVGIEGLGPATIGALVTAGVLTGPADLYRLRREDLLATTGLGPKAADRLLASIEASKRTDFGRFIRGLGIPQVGAVAARKLATVSGDLAGLAALDAGRLTEELGPSAATSVQTFLSRPEAQAELRAFLEVGVRPVRSADPARPRVELPGKVFVFTGALPGISRAEATGWVRNAGGLVRETVSIQTDYVVAGDNPGTKLADARRLGVTILTPAEFKALLGLP